MAGLFDLSRNYSIYSIPVAVILGQIPGVVAKAMAGNNYDSATPRTMLSNVEKDETLDKTTKGRIYRADAAANNALETLPLFMGAVIAANVAGVPAETTNVLAAAYLACRALYTVTYVWLQDNRKFAPLRSATFTASLATWMTLFVKAGNRFYAASK
ncbi:hypothetical protein F4778DRAFT_762650 [Xylariomycetidae sp. FL2044]|nr:hypothetical protein F4778DRAFT_762650 [Xylariomycetidae sp. FL2044]